MGDVDADHSAEGAHAEEVYQQDDGPRDYPQGTRHCFTEAVVEKAF